MQLVSKLQRHRCPTFGVLRPRNRRGQTGRYIFIYIDIYTKFDSAGNRTRVSGSVAKNSDRQTTEAVSIILQCFKMFRNFIISKNILVIECSEIFFKYSEINYIK
jgi:hypothetical protein